MKTWSEYKNQQLKQEGDSQEALGNISLDGRGEDALSTMYRLINLAWQNHRAETKDFFNKLSKKDHYIQQEWEKIEHEASRLASAGAENDDVVMIPASDNGNGDEGDMD